MKRFYDSPTQVKFYDINEDRWVGGIANEDYIICGCCGSKIEIFDLFAEAEDTDMNPNEIIKELSWIDIDETIRGDDD